MTSPFNGPSGAAPINIDSFCCADPTIGGCPHPGTTHTGPNGECQGVFGCSCRAFRKHRSRCEHNSPSEEAG